MYLLYFSARGVSDLIVDMCCRIWSLWPVYLFSMLQDARSLSCLSVYVAGWRSLTCVGAHDQAARSLIFLSRALSSVWERISLYVKTALFPCEMCRFWGVWSVSRHPMMWSLWGVCWYQPNMCDFSELFVGVCSRMCLSHLPVYFDSGRSLICLWLSSQDFIWYVSGWVSQDLLSVVSLWVQSPTWGLICLSLYVPGRKVCWVCFAEFYVCDLFEGVCSRMWGFWSISVLISQHVRSVNILSLYVAGCDISDLFMCLVKFKVSDLFLAVYSSMWNPQLFLDICPRGCGLWSVCGYISQGLRSLITL